MAFSTGRRRWVTKCHRDQRTDTIDYFGRLLRATTSGDYFGRLLRAVLQARFGYPKGIGASRREPDVIHDAGTATSVCKIYIKVSG
jgi:hypothetical protein